MLRKIRLPTRQPNRKISVSASGPRWLALLESSMKRSLPIDALAIPLLCLMNLGTQQAFACGNGNLLYEDTMQSLDESWGWTSDDPTRSVGAAGISWTLAPNSNLTLFNQTSLYNDFEVCVDLTMDKRPETSGGYLGVALWGFDTKNNYTIDIFPADGAVSVYRAQNGKFLKPVPYFKSGAVKTEPGATNELSVVVTGKHAVISVNGTKVKEFNGVVPAEGGLVGMDFGTSSSDSGPSTITFANFQVREPPVEGENQPTAKKSP
jgi:hypothetical protein